MPDAGSPAPRCLTLILCEVLIVDRVTNKPSIIGATINIDAPGFPLVAGPLWVFTEFTNGHGRFDFSLRIMDPDERPVFESGFQIMLGNPLDIAPVHERPDESLVDGPSCDGQRLDDSHRLRVEARHPAKENLDERQRFGRTVRRRRQVRD